MSYDIVGIGFGPSNLALAIALSEWPRPGRPHAVFLERKPRFGWHQGLLLEDTTMQVSFLKDLVTLRDPTSSFTFLSYLHERGRLVDFINHKSLFPSRLEFHDYLEWTAARLRDVVKYGAEVIDVQPFVRGSRVEFWDVVAARGEPEPEVARYRTRNVVIATGLVPELPGGVVSSARVWHSAELVPRLAAWRESPEPRFAVVGAGQSAAEVAAHLHQRFRAAHVYAIMSRYGYSPADDSPFANRVFDPAAVDDFYAAPPGARQRLFDYHANTNYSVVDVDLIAELYRRRYQEKVTRRQRLHLMNMSRVAAIEERPDGAMLTVEGPAGATGLTVDVVVFATGYRPMDPAGVLDTAARYCERDAEGRFVVGRDYRVATAPEVRAGIYLQGGVEHSHGLSAPLLSNVAIRAGEIAASITGRSGQGGPREGAWDLAGDRSPGNSRPSCERGVSESSHRRYASTE
jgi:L-ornithine N5-oxygenase